MARRILDRILHGGEWLSALAASWIPFLLLLALSILYLIGAAQTLLAPGAPVQVTYDAQKGRYRLRAESYAIYPLEKMAILQGVRLMDESGRLVGQIGTLRASIQKGAVHVKAQRGLVQVTRRKDLDLSIADVLPPSQDEGPSTPAEILLEDIQLIYRDASALPELRNELTVKSAHIAIADGKGVARGKLLLPRGEAVPVSARWNDTGGIYVEANSPRAELGWALPHVSRWLSGDEQKLLANSRAESLVSRTDFTLTLEPKMPLKYTVQADLVGRGITVPDYARNASVQVKLSLVTDQLTINATVTEIGRNARFDGVIDWQRELVLLGNLKASAANHRAVWKPLLAVLPRDLAADRPAFDGSVAWKGDDYELAGTLRADRISYAGEQARSVDAAAKFNSNGMQLNIRKATSFGSPLRGSLTYRFKGGQLSGFARTTKPVALGPLAGRFGVEGLTGYANVTALFDVALGKPRVEFAMQGSGTYTQEGFDPIRMSRIDARATYQDGMLALHRVRTSGPLGSAAAHGRVNLTKRSLDVQLDSGGLDLSPWSNEIGGVARFAGRVHGGFDSPVLEGKIGVTDAEVAGRPIARFTSDVWLKNNLLKLSDATLAAEEGRLSGQLALDLKRKTLQGSMLASQLQLADWAQDAAISGVLTAGPIQIGGTFDEPVATVDLAADKVLAKEYAFTNIRGRVTADKHGLKIEKAGFTLGEGSATVEGHSDYDGRNFALKAFVDALDLNAVVRGPAVPDIQGRISGKIDLSRKDGVFDAGDSELKLKDLRVEGAALGSGTIIAKTAAGRTTGSISVGQDNRYILGENLSYDSKSKEIGGELTLFNAPVADWVQPSTLRKRGVPEEWVNALAETSGNVTAALKANGTTDNPVVSLDEFSVENFVIAGRNAGELTAKGEYGSTGLTVKSLLWNVGRAAGDERAFVPFVRAKGFWGSDGNVDFRDIRIGDFDLSWLHTVRPDWPEIQALVSTTIDVNGAISKPTLTGTLAATYLGNNIDPEDPQLPNINLDTVSIRDGILRIGGAFAVQEFSGTVEGTVPLEAFDERRPNPDPFSIVLKANERDLHDMVRAFPGLDPERSSGKLGGSLAITGTLGDTKIVGGLNLANCSIAAKDVATSLQNMNLAANWSNSQLQVKGSAASSAGGTLAMDLMARTPNPLEEEIDLASFLSGSVLSGNLRTDSFRFVHEPNTPSKKIDFTLAPTTLFASGSLKSPEIRGDLLFSNVDFTVPETGEPGDPVEYLINPIFRAVNLRLTNPAIVRTASTTLTMTGGGKLDGSAQQPQAYAKFRLADGKFTLPNAVIDLEEDGEIEFRYDSLLATEASSRLDLRLVGRTRVTARSFTDSPERYEVLLQINGNLLEPGGLVLRATSDPPDLSESEILAILGQKELIEQIARGTGRNQQDALQGAALTLATPLLSGYLTQPLARGFKLDYLSVEYNPFDGYIGTASKTLGKGLTLTGRRQLTDPISGGIRKYDIRLTYRIPSRNRLLSRLRFGIGVDELRPWKITIDYFTRIRL